MANILDTDIAFTTVLPGFEELIPTCGEHAHESGESIPERGGSRHAERGKERCGVKCTCAHGSRCNCICGGVNHGKAAGVTES